jgi:hypothetical protein
VNASRLIQLLRQHSSRQALIKGPAIVDGLNSPSINGVQNNWLSNSSGSLPAVVRMVSIGARASPGIVMLAGRIRKDI